MILTMTGSQADRKIYDIADNAGYAIVEVNDPTAFGGADHRWMLVDADNATAPSYADALAISVWERPRWLAPRAWGETRDALFAHATLAGYHLSTEDQAAAATGDAFVARHTGGLPTALNRAEYESRCQDAGITAYEDADCDAYSVQYGAFDASNDQDGTRRVAQALAARRQLALSGQDAEPAPPRAAPATSLGFAPAGTTDAAAGSAADAPSGTCSWRTCSLAGWHNPGAGVTLCQGHWDAY